MLHNRSYFWVLSIFLHRARVVLSRTRFCWLFLFTSWFIQSGTGKSCTRRMFLLKSIYRILTNARNFRVYKLKFFLFIERLIGWSHTFLFNKIFVWSWAVTFTLNALSTLLRKFDTYSISKVRLLYLILTNSRVIFKITWYKSITMRYRNISIMILAKRSIICWSGYLSFTL